MKNKVLFVLLTICVMLLIKPSSTFASEYFGGSMSFFNKNSYPGVTSSVVWEFEDDWRLTLSNSANLILGMSYKAISVKSDLKYAIFITYPRTSIIGQLNIGVLVNLELKNVFGEPYIYKMSQRGVFVDMKLSETFEIYCQWIPRIADSLLPIFNTRFVPEVVMGAEYVHDRSDTSVRGEVKLSSDYERSYIKMGVGRKF